MGKYKNPRTVQAIRGFFPLEILVLLGIEAGAVLVDAGEVLVAGLIYLAVALYVVVVAGEAEAAVVAGDERGHGERPVLARRRTVNND